MPKLDADVVVLMAQEMPTQNIAERSLRGIEEALTPYREAGGGFRFRLDALEDKAAFHAACQSQLDQFIPGWKWRRVPSLRSQAPEQVLSVRS